MGMSSRHRWIAPLLVLILAIVQLIFGILSMVSMLRLKSFFAFHADSVRRISPMVLTAQAIICTALLAPVLADLIVLGSHVVFLGDVLFSRSHEGASAVLKQIVVSAIETNAVLVCLGIGHVASFLARNDLVWTAFGFATPRACALTSRATVADPRRRDHAAHDAVAVRSLRSDRLTAQSLQRPRRARPAAIGLTSQHTQGQAAQSLAALRHQPAATDRHVLRLRRHLSRAAIRQAQDGEVVRAAG